MSYKVRSALKSSAFAAKAAIIRYEPAAKQLYEILGRIKKPTENVPKLEVRKKTVTPDTDRTSV
jgi:hypothetical protein